MTDRGFTLLELLIAVGILLILTTQTTIYMKGIHGLVSEMKVERDLYHATVTTLHIMERDIRFAFRRPLEQSIDAEDEPQFFGRPEKTTYWPTFLVGEKTKLDFTSLSNVRLYEESKESNHNRVFYKLENDPENEGYFRLKRQKLKYIDEETKEEQKEEIILKNIKKLELAYFDSQQSSHPWIESWDSEKNSEDNLFPKAVRITLETEKEISVKRKDFQKTFKKVQLKTVVPIFFAQKAEIQQKPEPAPPTPPTPPTPPGP
ncbi:MAG: prepilin-type N-terminal cleavage/methylation domain-containing protein [Deltaproteobacteria bacterium]|nr:prepilin-type N-terminal cleavage/methylation domain-containing protein [Deltaproteobacteria bacterium]